MICFASVTESVRITRWRVGGLFATNTRQSIQPDKVFALRVRLDYTGKIC